ncbi:MAG TPA: hypothetical protein VG826_17635 [Pirellulales bacterium]|nr:hypothetical protein [Pirellulales bacterium]
MPPRWLQISLRGFLIVLTASCVWLGWRAERARKRERAINALVDAGGGVSYADRGMFLSPYTDRHDHFWLDMLEASVMIQICGPLDAAKGFHLSQISNLSYLEIEGPLTDADLRHLESLQGSGTVLIYDAEVTEAGVRQLQQKRPAFDVTWIPANGQAAINAKNE